MEFGVVPKRGVFCLKDHPPEPINVSKMHRLDSLHIVRNADNPTWADQLSEIELVHTACSFNKVIRRVDMRSRMGAESQFRYIRRISSRQTLRTLHLCRWVACVDGGPCADRHCYVVDFHQTFRIIYKTPFGKICRKEAPLL